MLQALAHPLRLQLLQVLAAHGELSCSELQQQAKCSQSMLSQQVKLLETQGLIATRKAGTIKLCRIRNPEILNLFACMRHHLELLTTADRPTMPAPAPGKRTARAAKGL
ncbi:MAG: hypothetical protein A3K19_20925 [Lentisphaerae bacterium RIFOXYB12_FULL_65_16]|nr:MAG: hypothetical protein A3K18_19350 [Lentisphaerae bacterium RIFOXYA12_64_32]OGV85198.1 MAG: hypothetical protein A3K19_20925 [Lentisphaerae bacterium RIFOXYB12_FULL_65_16]